MNIVRVLRIGVLFGLVVAAPALASGGRAMTWSKISHGVSSGVDEVGCTSCNPYVGDTACTTALPILCLNVDGSPTPSGLATDFYNGWARGNIATTQAIPGTWLTSQAVADQYCVNYFGVGWRMAEFHDGGVSGGWNWYAYGNVRSDTRYWVRISDQPANCWNP